MAELADLQKKVEELTRQHAEAQPSYKKCEISRLFHKQQTQVQNPNRESLSFLEKEDWKSSRERRRNNPSVNQALPLILRSWCWMYQWNSNSHWRSSQSQWSCFSRDRRATNMMAGRSNDRQATLSVTGVGGLDTSQVAAQRGTITTEVSHQQSLRGREK